MIKDILIPKKFGNYFIFSQQIIGIDIGRTQINATQITASGLKISIDKCWQEPLEISKKTHDERVVTCLKELFSKIDQRSNIHTALSSSQVVFKTLKLPFLNHNKLKMVIPFEVEPLLPFSLQDAIIDFIITQQHHAEGTSEILVAAVQKQHIAHHLSLFQAAGLDPSVITVDMFALYGLYTQIPAYDNQTGTSIIIDLGVQSTRLAAIKSKKLYMIRSLPQGLSSIAKDISITLDMPFQQALEQIMRFGLAHTDPQFQQALTSALSSFWTRVQFALSSLTNTNTQEISKILLLGSGSEINGMIKLASEELAIACEQFDISKLKENNHYILKNMQTIPNSHILSIANALPIPITQNFNLRAQEFTVKSDQLMLKQVIVTVALIMIMCTALLTHLIIQKRALKKEIKLSENETIEMLKARFPSIGEEEDDLEFIKDSAESELKREEELWYAFANQSRTSFLEYLLELTSRINKQELGFVPEQITITDGREGSIILRARVRDFEALKKLEQALRESKLFTFVEGQTSPDFTMKILVGKREDK